MRNISLNAHYIVLFKSPRDKQQIYMLARQINPGKVQEFMRSYEDATSRPHGYLVLDLKPTTDDQQRLKTNVLPKRTSKRTNSRIVNHQPRTQGFLLPRLDGQRKRPWHRLVCFAT